jgi:hypothetical protein
MQQNRRRTERNKTYLGARIIFNHRSSTMDCLMRNMNAAGARLVLTNTASLPDEFDVQVPRLERTLQARAVWRRQNEMGVSFVSRETGSNIVPLDLAVRLRKLESEKTALQGRVVQLTVGD